MRFIDQGPDLKVFRLTALEPRFARGVVRMNGATQQRIPFLRKLLYRCAGMTRLSYRAVLEAALQQAQRELKAAQDEAIIENRA